MTTHDWRDLTARAACLVVLALSACSSTGPDAPVEQRTAAGKGNKAPITNAAGTSKTATAPNPAAGSDAPPPVVLKPGEYMVKPGDTLTRIGLENGQGWRDLARWNNLENPHLIEVGQILRVVPPPGDVQTVAVRPSGIEARPLEIKPLDKAKPVLPGKDSKDPTKEPAKDSGKDTAAKDTGKDAAKDKPKDKEPSDNGKDADDSGVQWAWPASGAVLSGFDEKLSKGVSIAGKAGDPVLAAADGRVVYAGSSLRGYGNLVIVKHAGNYLTAYAHNQTLLVKEEQAVRRGQKIAEMGSTDADRVKLHFELRKQGKPVDPVKLLPSR